MPIIRLLVQNQVFIRVLQIQQIQPAVMKADSQHVAVFIQRKDIVLGISEDVVCRNLQMQPVKGALPYLLTVGGAIHYYSIFISVHRRHQPAIP